MKRPVLYSLLVLAAASIASAHGTGSFSNRISVDLTIYNQQLSLVRELRTLNISRGMSAVVLPDIPAAIDGTSLHFSSITHPGAVRVLEQNYQYDLVNSSKMLERYLGKEIEFVRVNSETNKEYTVRGKLLSTGSGLIAEIGGRIEINPPGRLVLPGLPDGLVLTPQLEWLVSSDVAGKHTAEISYLTGSISWLSNYVAVIDSTDTGLDLTGWVTVSNNSGTTFTNAHLKLVAGDVNVIQQSGRRDIGLMSAKTENRPEAPQFTQAELFEYKLYSLQRPTTVRNNETKQIELVSGSGVTSHKVFLYDGLGDQWRYWYNNDSYRSQNSVGQQSNPKVGVFVMFRNDTKSGLGLPLPKGKVRVYKRDQDGKEQFIGEDDIDHTPKDEEVRLYLGNAFDIVGERVQKDFEILAGGNIVEETIAVTLRNHKNVPVEVVVYEHPWRWSQWDIIRASTSWEKADHTTVKIPVRLAKDQETTVTYTIRYSW